MFSNVTRTEPVDVTSQMQGPFIARNPLQELFNKVDLFINQKNSFKYNNRRFPNNKKRSRCKPERFVRHGDN